MTLTSIRIRLGPMLHGYWQWDWRDTYTPLAGAAAPAASAAKHGGAGSLGVGDPSLLGKVRLGARFYALNLKAELATGRRVIQARLIIFCMENP